MSDLAGLRRPGWLTCEAKPPCSGVQAASYERCLAHLTDEERGETLGRLGPGADIDGRGISFTEPLIRELLAVVSDPETRRPHFGLAIFEDAQFIGDADFSSAIFDSAANFGGVTFHGDAIFRCARFRGPAEFASTQFTRRAGFGHAEFDATASFASARFTGFSWFTRGRFRGIAEFDGVHFQANSRFDEATFDHEAKFEGSIWLGSNGGFNQVRFTGDANFSRASFSTVDFAGAKFEGASWFNSATFGASSSFQASEFTGDAHFDAAEFAKNCGFRRAIFGKYVVFVDVDFGEDADFSDVTFKGLADFSSASLGDRTRLGPCQAVTVDLSGGRIGRGVLVQCRAKQVDAHNLHCPDGFNLQLDDGIYIDARRVHSTALLTLSYSDGHLMLANAAFESPAIIATPIRSEERSEDCPDSTGDTKPEDAPKILSLKRVDAANLALVGLDLRSCRFLDCYNRAGLRIDTPKQFARQPAERRWTRRRVVAEEHLWRARYDKHPTGWFPDSCRHPGESAPQHKPVIRTSLQARQEAARIQTIYRDLRKGREDAKDEPGATDFYYGEMEMRRLAAPAPSVERTLLATYWMLAGYGLRATRALGALLVLLVLGTVGFATVGFAASTQVEYRAADPSSVGLVSVYRQVTVPGPRPGWTAAFDHSIDSATSLFRTTQSRPLTPIGQGLEIGLRILGPLLLGLVILAVRGRVKR